MQAINSFISLFSEVWKVGIFGINASEIIIGLLIFLFFEIGIFSKKTDAMFLYSFKRT